ncbi:MAG: hypothetical protein ABSG95_02755 [Solirubrobacteraceae bacterium]|jgi:hypothetical protein
MRSGPAYTWGTTARDRSRSFPCDQHLPDAEDAYFRGVDVDAPAEVLFRWLCQLRVAPYSYDWIDNRGRCSPRELTPDLERLSVGQSVMRIFKLVEFDLDRHLTILTPRPSRLFGEVAVSYLVVSMGPLHCRLLVKVLVRHPSAAPLHRFSRELLPWGDLVMMRRQLRTLKHLAERRHGAGG